MMSMLAHMQNDASSVVQCPESFTAWAPQQTISAASCASADQVSEVVTRVGRPLDHLAEAWRLVNPLDLGHSFAWVLKSALCEAHRPDFAVPDFSLRTDKLASKCAGKRLMLLLNEEHCSQRRAYFMRARSGSESETASGESH